jgi:hypothetical protein
MHNHHKKPEFSGEVKLRTPSGIQEINAVDEA